MNGRFTRPAAAGMKRSPQERHPPGNARRNREHPGGRQTHQDKIPRTPAGTPEARGSISNRLSPGNRVQAVNRRRQEDGTAPAPAEITPRRNAYNKPSPRPGRNQPGTDTPRPRESTNHSHGIPHPSQREGINPLTMLRSRAVRPDAPRPRGSTEATQQAISKVTPAPAYAFSAGCRAALPPRPHIACGNQLRHGFDNRVHLRRLRSRGDQPMLTDDRKPQPAHPRSHGNQPPRPPSSKRRNSPPPAYPGISLAKGNDTAAQQPGSRASGDNHPSGNGGSPAARHSREPARSNRRDWKPCSRSWSSPRARGNQPGHRHRPSAAIPQPPRQQGSTSDNRRGPP